MLDRSSTRYVVLLYLVDIVATLAALALSAAVRPYLPFGKELEASGGTIKPEIYLTAAVIWSVILGMASAYEARQIVRANDEMRAIVVGVTQSTLILAGFLYLTVRGLSRLLFVTFYGLDLVLLLTLRLGLRVVFKANRPPMPSNRVLVIGTNKVAASVGERVAELRWMGLDLVGYVSEDGITEGPEMAEADGSDDNEKLNAPLLGRLADVPALVRVHDISELIIALPLRAHDELPNLVALLGDLPVNIKVVPDFFDLVYFRSSIEELGGMPLIGIKEPVISPFARLAKRLLDLFVAGVALAVLSPVLAVTALLIKLDSPGSVIYRQQRVGEGGRLFWMFKFRTMVAGADKHEDKLMGRDSEGRLVFQKQPDDPRQTRLGRFLRRYSLDELPQFVNVLKGNMSLVGPRPELPLIVDTYQPWQRKRFAVPPGMTGWWQVNARGQQPLHLRTADDLYYIQNYSLLLDLTILWKTVGAVISGRGAF